MKKGKILISGQLLRDFRDNIARCLHGFFPVEINHLDNDVFEYVGYMDRFDSIEEGDPIPTYDFTLRTNGDQWEVLNVTRKD